MLILGVNATAQEIRIQGSATFSLDKMDISPGDDFDVSMESTERIDIDIKKLDKDAYWSIMVQKNDINWDNQVKIYVRRTNSGNGNGSVWSGWNYTRIGNFNTTFCTGYKKLNNIRIQYKIEGLDVTLESGTYYTDIVYTLFEN